jgi:luciferase family oxidoreductase group 1
VKFSALDSAPIRLGRTSADALADCLARAPAARRARLPSVVVHRAPLGPDVASSSPLTLVGQAATQTRRLRLGAGGVMIRNHAPLVAAEQVVTLSLLHPDRVDLGLGRSGGSTPATDTRIRRTVLDYVSFEEDVAETIYHLEELGADEVQVFVVASSRETATFAGRQGLGLAVAGHVAPAGMDGAVAAYRAGFRPRPGRAVLGWCCACRSSSPTPTAKRGGGSAAFNAATWTGSAPAGHRCGRLSWPSWIGLPVSVTGCRPCSAPRSSAATARCERNCSTYDDDARRTRSWR